MNAASLRPPALSNPGNPAKASAPVVSVLPPGSEQKRKRHRSWDGHAALGHRGMSSPARSQGSQNWRW